MIKTWLNRRHFRRYGFVVIKNFYPVNNHSKVHPNLYQFVRSLPEQPADDQSPGSPAYIGVRELLKVHSKCIRPVERYTGMSLYPTYCYMRIYNEHSVLPRHRDRPACEISCTLTIGADTDYIWPIHLTDLHGRDHAVVLQPGDALIYRGLQLAHWRENATKEVKNQAQVFLHYVNQDGPYEDLIYDIVIAK